MTSTMTSSPINAQGAISNWQIGLWVLLSRSSVQESLKVHGYASIKCLQNHEVITIMPNITLLREKWVISHHHAQVLGSKGDVQALPCHFKDNQSSFGLPWNKQCRSNNVKASLRASWVHLGTSCNSPTRNLIGLTIQHLGVHMRVKHHMESSHSLMLIYGWTTLYHQG